MREVNKFIPRIIFIVLLVAICFNQAFATHNRSGEITYRQIGPLTISATITTYTKASSTAADRDSLLLNWGDGTSMMVSRSNGNGDIIPGEDIKVNFYTAEHTYPGRATYTLSFEDPNRVNNIVNVNFPNSVDVPFFVSTTFTLINTQFQGFNNSVVLLQPPIDFACNNQRFIHNPNAFDIDGDSLSYELIVPLQSEGQEVPAYQFPNQVSAGPNNNIFLNPVTGDFIWDSPKQTGEYNIAIKINEWRNGVLLNSVIRDMQIRVQSCESRPPILDVEDEICVVAGERIQIPVFANDPDQGQRVRVFATGGPFLLEYSPAQFSGSSDFKDVPFEETFTWQTECEHISNNFYQVVFRAQDNSINNNSGLTVLKTLKIRVVGPPPVDLQSDTEAEAIEISWANPYQCEETINDYFIGFSVWRKENTRAFTVDSCTPGLEGKGYEVVRFLTNEEKDGRYFFRDTDVEKAKIYCYRVLANFAQSTLAGNPYNIVESLSSEEICVQLQQDFPLLTKASVLETSDAAGSVLVEWISPKPEDLDTIEFPGPYRYVLTRSEDKAIYEEIPGAEFTSPQFSSIRDFSYTDQNLNTINQSFSYIVDFYSDGIYYSSSPASSTVFLEIRSSDNLNELSWSENTSWQNYAYRILREEGGTGGFEEIATVETNQFTDRDVMNDLDYCYVVESEGTYALEDTPAIILNFSQINCGTPIDTVGPCTPELQVSNPCADGSDANPNVRLINELSWTRSDFICDDSRDIAFYNIYFSSSFSGEAELIATLSKNQNSFEHLPDEGINGCYRISAVDSLGNEGIISDYICVSNCPIYTLPNTFTPNEDGANELFKPIENRFVSMVDFKVFNRWGNKVFETDNPELNWNGMDLSGRNLDQGTYYYSCIVFDTNLEGNLNQVKRLSGYIQILK